jgi:ADP-ribosylation factor GTPase-activating protein 2/3
MNFSKPGDSYPDEVNINDVIPDQSSDTSTPAGEPGDDFFSSWDKPTIKRPSNPPSRTSTPANRTASPFLAATGTQNGSRPKSPATSGETPAAAAPRTVITSTARKTAPGIGVGGRKPGGIIGSKKSKLGVKKVVVSDDLDFDAAEKKAKEEADRIAKLGYDPDDEEEAAAHAAKIAAANAPKSMLDIGGPGSIISPTPVSPGARSGTGASDKNSQDVERLGMSVARLGFGQTASKKPAASAAPRSAGGFGAISRPAAVDGMYHLSTFHPSFPALRIRFTDPFIFTRCPQLRTFQIRYPKRHLL